MNIHTAQRGNPAGGKQERIAGQEGRNNQTGFAKNNQKQNCINPHTVLRRQAEQVLVDMQDKINHRSKHGFSKTQCRGGILTDWKNAV